MLQQEIYVVQPFVKFLGVYFDACDVICTFSMNDPCPRVPCSPYLSAQSRELSAWQACASVELFSVGAAQGLFRIRFTFVQLSMSNVKGSPSQDDICATTVDQQQKINTAVERLRLGRGRIFWQPASFRCTVNVISLNITALRIDMPKARALRF